MPLLDVRAVAALLNCSESHVWRLVDGKRLPKPLKIGRLVRWSQSTIEHWINQGCQPCKAS